MAGGGRIGGQGNLIQRGIWVFISLCIVVAVWNSFPHDGKGFMRELHHKSDQLKDVAGSVVEWIEDTLPANDSEPTRDGEKPADKTGNKSGNKPHKQH